MYQRFLEKLKQRFSNQPNFIQTDADVRGLPFKSLNSHWIVGRGKCMYRCERFDHVPGPKRESAVENKVKLWSPFERTGHHVVWSDGTAMVWFWDDALVAAEQARFAPASDTGSRRSLQVLPETLFHPRSKDGVLLFTCSEGHELQLWANEILKDSTWFPNPPSESQIARFLDRNGLAGVNTQSPGSHALQSEPWLSRLSPKQWLLANERHIVAAALLLFSALIIFQEVRIWRISSATSDSAAEFELLQAQVGPLLKTRNEAQRLRLHNQQLARLVATPSQALLMSLVDEALPPGPAQFREWHFQQGQLRVIVEDPEASSIDYVRALEAEPLFDDVRVEQARGRDRLELNMTVASGR